MAASHPGVSTAAVSSGSASVISVPNYPTLPKVRPSLANSSAGNTPEKVTLSSLLEGTVNQKLLDMWVLLLR